MAWTAGADVTTADIITAATWNSYNGASGSLEYLKTEADKINTAAAGTGGATSGTVYQNTSGKIRLVTFSSYMDAGEESIVLSDSGNPPTTQIAKVECDVGDMSHMLGFLVPPNHYYKITYTNVAGVWKEKDYH